ncbi:MAG: hypothetical protein HND42_06060 [Armatimonadetes bacterium]|nr:MAG: hypothetical protein EDM73_11725 [Armatimonadota bacterium]MCE7900880.1 hypothetical protein [Armatimonadetes bacterium ATM1]MDL1929715.1 hypothetical protein [Fimbriimonadia bacterium ATM]MBC6970569.1 hypothetical protein [Armatimonadota bacterium]MBL1149757.1 hypothetical protein [Armatimonadota bacterium]
MHGKRLYKLYLAGLIATAFLAPRTNAGDHNYDLSRCDFLAVVKIIGNAGEYSFGPQGYETYVRRVNAEVVLALHGDRNRTMVQFVGSEGPSPTGEFNSRFAPGELRLCAALAPDANLRAWRIEEQYVQLENQDQLYILDPSLIAESWNFIRLPSGDYTVMGETKVEKWAGVLFQSMAATRTTNLLRNALEVGPTYLPKPPPANPWEYEFVGGRNAYRQEGPTYGAFFGRELLPMVLQAFADDPVTRVRFLSLAIGYGNAHLIEQWRRELLAFSRSDPQPGVARELRIGGLDPAFQKPLLSSRSASVRWGCVAAADKPDWQLIRRLVDDPVAEVRVKAIEWFEIKFPSAGAPERNYTREGVWTNESEVRAFWRSFRGD